MCAAEQVVLFGGAWLGSGFGSGTIAQGPGCTVLRLNCCDSVMCLQEMNTRGRKIPRRNCVQEQEPADSEATHDAVQQMLGPTRVLKTPRRVPSKQQTSEAAEIAQVRPSLPRVFHSVSI